MPLSASALALVLTAALSTTPQPAAVTTPQPLPQVETVRETVESYFADIPIMIAVSGCESHYRQFDTDGSVYRGEQNHQDVGVMQINEHYHLQTAQKLGYDIYTLQGNLAYARFLYEQEGTAPWSSSAYCWDKSSTKTLATVGK